MPNSDIAKKQKMLSDRTDIVFELTRPILDNSGDIAFKRKPFVKEGENDR